MNDKFNKLDDLINKYYELVKKHPDCLPPYATFKTYLVDDGNCCNDGHKCVDRPRKIKELVNKLMTENNEEKLEGILELWSHGGNIYLDGEQDPRKKDKLIHSVSNTTRLQVFLKGGENKDDRGVVIDKKILLTFATKIATYIKSFETKNSMQSSNDFNHRLVENDDFKDLIENNIDSVVNELLFWYYYNEDTYPIINSRAKNSRHILNRSFPKEKTNNDFEFNKRCMEILKDKELLKVEEKIITKQLMLDQLFYSIDEMKSMEKTEKQYLTNKNEIYYFYEKLWNTVREAKSNKYLQIYYNEFIDVNYNEKWYKVFKNRSDILHTLQDELKKETNNLYDYNYINKKFNEISKTDKNDFLDQYVFQQSNGIAGAGQDAITQEQHKKNIRNKIENTDTELLYKILTCDDISETDSLIEEMLYGDKHYALVKNRFLAALFSEKMTTVVYTRSFNSLVSNLKKKFNIKLETDNYIEQNNELMGFYLKNSNNEETDIYKKQQFYWWLFEKLNDNLDLKKAVVYYGSPGTGKTYKAKKVAKDFIRSWSIKNNINSDTSLIEVVQFHPSFSYEDFIEGIRPSKGKDLELRDGIFKEFCKKTGEIEIALWKNNDFREKYQKENNDFSTIKAKDILDLTFTFNNKEEKTLKEKLGIMNIDDSSSLLDIIPPAFFIIDEINRADLSRVFGELMYSLEYRGYEGKIKTQYSYLVDCEEDKSVFFYEKGGNYFFIPQNVYIVGTMNTIDRSVDSFDFALRRRFFWEEILPNYEVIEELLDDKIAGSIASAFKNLNNKIKSEPLLGRDYQIGHSYALNLKNRENKKLIDAKKFLWDNFIYPLLQEYFRGLGDSESKIKDLNTEFFKNDKK